MFSPTAAIKSDAQYLLIIRDGAGNDPHPKLVQGNILFACATRVTPTDMSLQNGVHEYLKQYGQWDGYESIQVEVHEFDSAAIFEAEYKVENKQVQ